MENPAAMSLPDANAQPPQLQPYEARIINELQGGFPLEHRPFDSAGQALGLSGQALREAIASLLKRKVLTRFGPLFQIERMGGQFVLAALQVPEARYDTVTTQVNAFDAVAHNYRREHALNMWFVLATSSAAAMQEAIAGIKQATALKVHAFPKLEEYFVGMRFTVGGEHPVGTEEAGSSTRLAASAKATLQDDDWPLIRAAQAGLPLVDAPYAILAAQLGWTEEHLLERLQALLDVGIIRRIGVVPNHYAIGYRFNAMGVFDVDDAAIAALGPQVGSLDFVTHCYRRPRDLPVWPYNLFAMCHGASRDSVLEQVAQVRSLLGDACKRHDALFSTRILKKSGLRV